MQELLVRVRISAENRVDCIRRESDRKDSYEHAFNRLLDRNRAKVSNLMGVGGLLFIPSVQFAGCGRHEGTMSTHLAARIVKTEVRVTQRTVGDLL